MISSGTLSFHPERKIDEISSKENRDEKWLKATSDKSATELRKSSPSQPLKQTPSHTAYPQGCLFSIQFKSGSIYNEPAWIILIFDLLMTLKY